MAFSFHLPIHTPDSAFFTLAQFCLRYKKGVGVCSPAYPGTVGLRIASHNRIDNAVSPRQYDTIYIGIYNTHHVDASLSSACL